MPTPFGLYSKVSWFVRVIAIKIFVVKPTKANNMHTDPIIIEIFTIATTFFVASFIIQIYFERMTGASINN